MMKVAGWLACMMMLAACRIESDVQVVAPDTRASTPMMQADQDAPTFAFVGERLAIRSEPAGPGPGGAGEEARNSLDDTYRARYRVLQPLAGSVAGNEIEFRVASHRGFPAFARYPVALLFVSLQDDGPWLHRYQGYPLHRTVDGEWATCGEVESGMPGRPSRGLRPLQFAGAIALQRDLPEGLLQSHAAGSVPWLSLRDGKAWCSQGVPLEDAYSIIRTGVMAARGVVLPAWQEDALPVPESRWSGQ